MIGNKANILGVRIDSSSKEEVLKTIVNAASGVGNGRWEVGGGRLERKTGSGKLIIFTPNPEFIVEANCNPNFKNLLNKADINLPDGVGLVIAGKLLGQPIKERVSGADVVEKLLEMTNDQLPMTNDRKKQWTVGVAGARRGVLAESNELVKRLQQKYPNVSFVNLDSLNFKFEILNLKSNLNDQILNVKNNPKFNIQNSKFNVVFAAHGMKKQEQWIWENKDKLKANVMMGAGGSLDFLTGFTKRSPLWIRGLGMEWLWRGLQKPRHFKRIWKAVFVFGFMIVKEMLNRRLSHKFND